MTTSDPPLYIRMLAWLISIVGYTTSLLSVLIVQIFPPCNADYPIYYSDQPSHHLERRLSYPTFVSPSGSKQDAMPSPQKANPCSQFPSSSYRPCPDYSKDSDMPQFTDPFEARRNLAALPVRSVTLPQFIPRGPSPKTVEVAARTVLIPDIVIQIPEEGSNSIHVLPQSTACVSSRAQTLLGTKNALHMVFYKRWYRNENRFS
ncbi:hypothetical protein EDD18DRAFT_49505 [Armillaria luteobubalina]|uniref:Uncharacterized protein n=1 Tax=Armillaria luteobubalina TaxID=153913 RepID=A0AA39TRQ1_9AGAR|nr:hypothetical protein EDD18DRAFT_49505 [Armillaria luteobubalina]